MISITVEPTRNDSELELLRAGMRRQTEKHVPWESYNDLTVVLRDADDRFLGAALGEAGRGWLHISVIWIDEEHRGLGYGRELLKKIESEGVRHGCRQAYLDTFSYQAKPFYEQCGYSLFGTLEEYPPGHSRYFLRKQLV